MAGESAERWGIVLAAGDGARMAEVTRALYGQALPKQFAAFRGTRSLLQTTVDRLAPLVAPERTVVVVAEAHEDLARLQLAEYPGVDIVAQPANLGTGPGLLLPLTRVIARDPDARVIVSPSDHHVGRPDVFLDALARGDALSARQPGRVTLLGAVPDRAASDLGWILPGGRIDCGAGAGGDVREVAQFIEKPPLGMAERLLRSGGLWNTLVLFGSATTLWSHIEDHLPRQASLLEQYLLAAGATTDRPFLRRIYSVMQAADLSRLVLERSRGLAVLPVAGSGWSDWGTPERLFRGLEQLALGGDLHPMQLREVS